MTREGEPPQGGGEGGDNKQWINHDDGTAEIVLDEETRRRLAKASGEDEEVCGNDRKCSRAEKLQAELDDLRRLEKTLRSRHASIVSEVEGLQEVIKRDKRMIENATGNEQPEHIADMRERRRVEGAKERIDDAKGRFATLKQRLEEFRASEDFKKWQEVTERIKELKSELHKEASGKFIR